MAYTGPGYLLEQNKVHRHQTETGGGRREGILSSGRHVLAEDGGDDDSDDEEHHIERRLVPIIPKPSQLISRSDY